MAATTPPPSVTAYRIVVVLLLLLAVLISYAGYLYEHNADLKRKNVLVTNNYKTVRDSVAHVSPKIVYVPTPGPVVRVPVPLTATQVASIRQGVTADVTAMFRREVSRLAPKPPKVTLALQKPMVLALHDSVNVTRKPGTNKLSLSTLKTGSFQDKWLSLNTVVRPGKNGRPDSMEVKYQLRNEYDVSAWVKRPKHKFWPFGKRRIYVSLTSRNPNAKDAGLESIPVKKATKKP